MTNASSEQLTIEQAAERTKVPQRVLEHAIKRKQLPASVGSDGVRRVSLSDLTIFVNTKYDLAGSGGAGQNGAPASNGESHGGIDQSSGDLTHETVQALQDTISGLRQELEETHARLEQREAELEAERQRNDEDRRLLLKQIQEANSFAEESSSGTALERLRPYADGSGGLTRRNGEA